MNKIFKDYERAVIKAQNEMGKSLISKIQSLLKIARNDGDFYVCTGMGLCSLSAESFKVIYKDEPESGIHEDKDDFDLGEKLMDDGPYGVVVQCSKASREALIEVHEICEYLGSNQDCSLMSVLPFKVFADKIEK